MPDRLTDLLLILAIIFCLWASQDTKSIVDYGAQTWHGIQAMAQAVERLLPG